MVLANGRPSPYEGQNKEEQPGDFQPEHVQYTLDAAEGDAAGSVEGAHPAVFATLPSRNA
jgi:hypothetical protein